MNKRAKQRLIGVTILIFVAVGALVAFAGFSGGTATRTSVAEALADPELVGRQVEVTGEVVAGSWVSGTKPFTFEIQDGDDSGRITVVWDNVVPGSFGDGVTATATGVLTDGGVVEAKYLVTQCPSKYESATGAMTVNDVINRADELIGSTLKVSGRVVAGSIVPAGGAERFRISDGADGADPLPISFGGGLSEEFVDGAKVVITGSIEADGIFQATDVALDSAAK